MKVENKVVRTLVVITAILIVSSIVFGVDFSMENSRVNLTENKVINIISDYKEGKYD